MTEFATPSFESFPDILGGWAAAGGSSEEERIEFASIAFHELRNDPNQFQEFVKHWQVGTWTNKVDASFDKVTRRIEGMGEEHRAQFPNLTDYLYQWIDTRTVRSIFRLVYTF